MRGASIQVISLKSELMEKVIHYYNKKDRFARLNGIELVACRPGYAVAVVQIKDRHLNSVDMVHGGLLFTLADFAFAAAVNAHGRVTLSITNNINYFKKCSKGLLTAEARELSRSNKLINCDVSIKDEEGKLLANFNGTAYITKENNSF